MRIGVFIVSVFWIGMPLWAQQQVVADPPEVRGPFYARGHVRLRRWTQRVRVQRQYGPAGDPSPAWRCYQTALRKQSAIQSDEMCATSRCTNMTNLHFHGLHVSPRNPQDDVLTMMAMPGQALDYKVDVPSYAASGLYLVSYAPARRERSSGS